VVANFVNGSATVAFYNKVRTFTYEEFLAGELQAWLTETYTWWQALSPCSTATAETQQAQQTAQNATQAAQTAQSAAANAAAAVPPPVSTPPPPATNTTNTNGTSGTNTTGSTSQNTSGNTTSGNEQSSSGTSSGGTEGGTSSGGNTSEGSSNEGGQTSESKTEDTSTETKSESDGGGDGENTETESTESESTEENKEESKEEVKEEESKEEESSEEKEEESKEEESEEKEEEKKEEKKEKKEKKQSKMMPIQLRSDMMANQALLGKYDIVTSIGATQSSIFGDESYGATMMIWSNLRQFSLNTSYTKVHMEKFNLSTLNHGDHTHYSKTKDVSVNDPIDPPTPKLSHITSASVGYMNNFGNGAMMANMMKIKPTKYGTFGAGLNMANNFGEGKYQNTMLGYNILYTNQVMLNPRINYAPAFIWTQSPYVGTLNGQNQMRGQRIHGMIILANSFTIQLTRRFSFNVGATFIKSTDPNIPLIKSFMIGAKLPF
jgi:hypothetical protein